MDSPISSIVGGTRRELCAMPWTDYLAYPALNGSVIVDGRKSLLHLKHAWDHGREDSDSMQFGRLLHSLLFDHDELETRYRAWKGRRAGKDWTLFCQAAQADGVEVIKATGDHSLEAALEAVPCFLENGRVRKMIAAGQTEQAVFAVEHGLQCKGRLDGVSTAEHVLYDLKTAAEIESRLFGLHFFRYGYDLKLGMYRRWLNELTGEHWPVEVIVLENKRPYDVAVVPVPDAVLDAGVDKALDIIQAVRRAIETDTWPGVAGDELYPLQVPFHEMQEEVVEYHE